MKRTRWKFGSHLSIAGGYYRAVESAMTLGCDCVQIFTKNNNQWRAKPMTAEESDRFRSVMEQSDLVDAISHASYLINLASPKDDLWTKSIEAMEIELRRADQLGLSGVVVHPGAFVSSTPEAGIARIAAALTELQVRYRCWRSWRRFSRRCGRTCRRRRRRGDP